MSDPTECDGWRRFGGAFSFGPPKWVRCTEKPTVMLEVKQPDTGKDTMRACVTCWKEALDNGIVLSATPIIEATEDSTDDPTNNE